MATVLSTFDASHEECRHRVCIVCYGRGSRTFSETEIETIQDFLIDGFDTENSMLQCRYNWRITLAEDYDEKPWSYPHERSKPTRVFQGLWQLYGKNIPW